jgi:hypothetical protein
MFVILEVFYNIFLLFFICNSDNIDSISYKEVHHFMIIFIECPMLQCYSFTFFSCFYRVNIKFGTKFIITLCDVLNDE